LSKDEPKLKKKKQPKSKLEFGGFCRRKESAVPFLLTGSYETITMAMEGN
jgi:hypothetical protein